MTTFDYLLFGLKIIAAVGCGLAAGVFFAFSTFVMNALGKIQPAHGIGAMQSINVSAINPWFMTALFGTAAACLFWTIYSGLKWQQTGSAYLLLGSLIYLAGTILVTIFFNVPLNNALAALDLSGADAVKIWNDYLRDWTFWNHVRTIASLVAAVLFAVALRY